MKSKTFALAESIYYDSRGDKTIFSKLSLSQVVGWVERFYFNCDLGRIAAKYKRGLKR